MLTIYKASAGSGKTYTLAFEYIKALLGIKDGETGTYSLNGAGGRHRRAARHRAILAITFTNKATEEMKTRIVRELNALARDCGASPYSTTLCGLFGCTADQLATEAAAALHDLLTDYRNFHVSTIDSFSQTVLRTFAREVDHQGDYEIELSDRYAVAAGVGMMMDDLNFGSADGEERIRDWIAGFMREQIDSGSSFNVFQNSRRISGSIVSYVARMCDEAFKPHAEACMAYLEDPHRVGRYRRAVAEARKACTASLREAAVRALGALDANGQGRDICRKELRTLLEDAADGRDPDAAKFGFGDDTKARTFKKICTEGSPESIFVASKLPKVKRATVYPPDALAEELHGAAIALRDGVLRCRLLDMLAPAARELEFLGLAWKYVAQYRRDNNVVLMSDTNDLLRRIINGSDVPFIYERIGMELEHFLIDEFQDTSVMQWDNLKPLVANGLDGLHDSLIIGDEKQAIYRFRNSDSSLLHHRVADTDFPTRHTTRGSDPADNTNHRSAHGIVRFNNALFARLADTLAVEGYENVMQALFGRFDGLESYVDFRSIAAIAEGGDHTPEDASMHAMAADILRQHDSGYRWRDIAILAAANDTVNALVEFLMREYPQIPLCSNEGLRLDRSAAVNLIISVLRYVDRSYSPEKATSPDTDRYATHSDILLLLSRFEYAAGRGDGDLRAALDHAMSADAVEDLGAEALNVRRANASGLPALVEVIISRCVPPEQRRRELAYLAAFQDCVLNYCTLYNPSVHAFLAWWDRMAPRQTVGASASLDAVSIMTIHKAKGLEWTCVHIPFATWQLTPRSETEWMPADTIDVGDPADRPPVLALPTSRLWRELGPEFAARYDRNYALQLADRLNMTYVAFTRPSRELTVHYGGRTLGPVLLAALQSVHPGDARPEGLCLPDGQRDDEEGRYTYGRPTTAAPRDRKEEQKASAPDYCVWMRDDTRELTTVTDSTAAALDHDLDIQTDTAAADPRQQARTDAARRGNDLHNILAQMRVEADLERSVALVGVRARFSEEQRNDYTRVLHEAFTAAGEYCSRWFAPGVRVLAERTIYVPERRESFRPDRIVMYPDGSIDIIDYKFTSEPLDEHRIQVRGYMNMLREMGHTRLHGYLWYPEQCLVIEV